MSDTLARGRRSALYGFGSGFAAVVCGVAISALLALNEESMRDGLRQRAEAVIETVYRDGGREAAKVVTDGAFALVQNARSQFMEFGVAVIALAIVVALFGRGRRLASVGLMTVGGGAIIVPARLVIASVLAPTLGSTATALDFVHWMATLGFAMIALGVLCTTIDLVLERACMDRFASESDEDMEMAGSMDRR